MANDSDKPVRLDLKKAIEKAKTRPDFPQAWDELSDMGQELGLDD